MMKFTLPRFRFSLRTMFVGSLLVALVSSWYGFELRAKQRHNAAENAIAERGGCVWYAAIDDAVVINFDVNHSMIVKLDSRGEQIKKDITFGDQDLPLLAKLRRLESVDFTGSQVSATAIKNYHRDHPSLTVKP